MNSFKNPFRNVPKSQEDLQYEMMKLYILDNIYQTIEDKEGQEYVRTQWEELRREEEAQLKAEETARLKADEKANQKKQNAQKSSSYSFQYKPAPTVPKQRQGLLSNEKQTGRKLLFIPVMIIVVLAGYWLYSPLIGDNIFTPSASSSNNDKATTATGNTNSGGNALDQVQEAYTNSIGMEFVLIPEGEFMMGSNSENDEQPVHEATIEQSYYLGKYEVTQKQWVEVMGSNPSYFDGDNNPVEQVSWNNVQEFIKNLNEMEGTDKYRLPSEAEWEYACRAGTTKKYSFGDDTSKLGEFAWYDANAEWKTHPVGQRKPNPWGFYDMHGNVWEWCQDEWHPDYNGAPTDGSAWIDGSYSDLVARGGSWYFNWEECRSANRVICSPGDSYRGSSVGFRLLLEV